MIKKKFFFCWFIIIQKLIIYILGWVKQVKNKIKFDSLNHSPLSQAVDVLGRPVLASYTQLRILGLLNELERAQISAVIAVIRTVDLDLLDY